MSESRTKMHREEIAAIEAGHTDVSPVLAWFLSLAFLLPIFSAPLLEQSGWGRDSTEESIPIARHALDLLPKSNNVRQRWSEGGLIHAFFGTNAEALRAIDAFENKLEDDSPLSKRIVPAMQSLLVGRLQAGTESVYCGRDGWLFFRPAMDYLWGPGFLDPHVLSKRSRQGKENVAPPQPDPRIAIFEFHRQLAERGIRLMIVPAPPKAALYPEQFTRRMSDSHILANPDYADFVAAMQAAGIMVCDTTAALMQAKSHRRDGLFLKTDTHWTPEGVRVAATEIARQVDSAEVLSETPLKTYSRMPEKVGNLGDLAALLDLPEGQRFYEKETLTIEVVRDGDGVPWESSTEAEILLLGDSYANMYNLVPMGWGSHAGLAAQLSAELQQPVDALIRNGAGANATREQLSRDLARGNDRLAGKKLVIWEFAARELAVGNWKTGFDMQVGEKRASMAAAPLHLRARLKTKSPVPTLEELAPYKENLTVFEYEAQEVLRGAYDAPTLYVAHWAVRDSKHMPWMGEVQPNTEVELWLQAFDANPKLSTVNLSDTVTTDFSLPLFHDAGGTSLGLSIQDRTLEFVQPPSRNDSSLQHKATATPLVLELSSRAKAERARLWKMRDAFADWEGWNQLLQPFREGVRRRIKRHREEQGESDILIGEDNFLFSCYSLNHLLLQPDRRAIEPATNVLVQLSRELAQRGIRLLVVPIPSNAEIYPDKVAAVPPDIPVAPLRVELMLNLLDRDVEVVDVLPLYEEARNAGKAGLCRQNDPHWDSLGIQLAAEAVAARLDLETTQAFTLRPKTLHKANGSLCKGLSEEERARYINPDITLFQVFDEEERLFQPAEVAPVLVFGDSYVNLYAERGAGIAAHLSERLGVAVSEASSGGGGPGVALMLARKPASFFENRSIFVLCFVARYLDSAQAERWKTAPLTP
jgi:hypothetical protein